MKALSACIIAGFFCTFSPVTELSFAPEIGSEVQREIWTRFDLALTEINIVHNGDDFSPDEIPELTMIFEQRQLVRDSYERVGEGRILELHRRFESLVEIETTESAEDGVEETESASELEGQTVVFRWDEDEEEFVVSFLEDEGDEELLEGLACDLDLIFALPEGDLSEGDTWEFEDDEIDLVLQLGGDVPFEDDDEEEEEEEGGMQELFDEAFDENMGGTLSCTFKGIREVDGEQYGVVHLVLDARGAAEKEADEAPPGGEVIQRASLEFAAEGEYLWDLAAGRLDSFKMEGTLRLEMGAHITASTPEGDFELDQAQVFEGDVEFGIEATTE